MCGFAGCWDPRAETDAQALVARARRMSARIAHRGPDDDGHWHDASGGYAVGFRRLAILDLSAAGHQPMASASGRYTLVFNGEIFNHHELRRALGAGVAYRGTSDTETLLAGIEVWGLRETLRRAVGMFAVALWDRETRTLTLGRDRLGKKPLHIARVGGLVLFASELKAIAAEPDFPRELDPQSIVSYLRHLYVPWPHTIFRHAVKLAPGTLLTLTPDAPEAEPECYWSAVDAARAGAADPLPNDPAFVLDELDRVMRGAVAQRLLADVPLGSLLSGGIDSSLVTAMAQAASGSRLRSFSVSFPDSPEHDEGAHAQAVATHLGTDHVELAVHGRDLLDVIPQMPHLFDEPMADHSCLPALAICREARRHVTVVLTGDGGDELFAGYHRYFDGIRAIRRLAAVPAFARRVGGRVLDGLGDDGLAAVAGQRLGRLPAQRMRKLARLMRAGDETAMYRSLVSAWEAPSELVPCTTERRIVFDEDLEDRRNGDLLARMMLADQRSYLVDDQLAKVDRVSMAVGLEARVPLLDHALVEFAWRIPHALKARDGVGKWIARQLLYERYVPRHLVDRPKVGFTVPLGVWLRGPLRPWAEALLAGTAWQEAGLLAEAPIRAAWARLQDGDDSRATQVWAVLMLLAWMEAWT